MPTNQFKKFINKTNIILKRGKPLLALKLAKINLNALLFNRIPPFRQVEIQVTFDCNLKCIHCSAANFSPPEERLTISNYENIAAQCRQYSVPMVSFTGGEPMVEPRLEEIIGLFDTKSTLISCTTNGTLLTEERAKKLKSIGLDSFVISLDGPDPASNDSIRGKGTYKKVMESIKIAKSYNFIVMIIHTLSHYSIKSGNFNKLIKLAESMDIPIHVSLASPTGNWSSEEAMKDFVLTEEDINYLWKCQNEFSFLRRDLDGNYRGTGCPAGTERFVISPNGEVMPCTKIQASFGNIKTETMIDIREKMAKIDLLSSNPKICLPAEHADFLKIYLPRVFNKKDLPIPYNKYFLK
ncbi:radical SAM protein [candidate division WS5 bacterium]|uniref:Radical SAM protein n=1 Tax=candidate division WS5 bacterium TaxID=2093353 RepID=A0A419DD20_9BACT|nr:MAG: radical SAM protein [candidate division WS5 bacterium]